MRKEAKRGALGSLELELHKVVIQPYECPGKAASALNCFFSPSPKPGFVFWDNVSMSQSCWKLAQAILLPQPLSASTTSVGHHLVVD